MNERFLNLAKINKDFKNQLDLWKASEEYKIPYPKMEFYLKYLIINNLRSNLSRNRLLQNEPSRAKYNPGNRELSAINAPVNWAIRS